MKRVASLYLPEWAVERHRRRTAPTAPPPDAIPIDFAPIVRSAAAERAQQCDAPKNTGWRPGARWAREEKARVQREIDTLPAHQRPSTRLLGRVSEPAAHPFKAMPPDEGGVVSALAGWRDAASVGFPGDGPHPDKHNRRRGSNDPHAGVPAFFSTGRSNQGAIAKLCPAISGTSRDLSESEDRHQRAAATHRARDFGGDGGNLLVLAHKVGSQSIIHAASPVARALGLTPGMAVTQARACVPALEIRDAQPAADRADLQALAVLLARRWCPVVAISGDDGLLLDLTGVAHLYGGEARLARRLVRLLARFGVTARIAIADTAGAAWALARFGRGGICPPGAQAAAIAPLPVAALRLDDRPVELMKRLGIDTVGALSALPRGPLVRRFGKPVALRLDQATGAAPEPLDPVEVRERIVVTQRFAEPIATAEAIEHWLRLLVARLCHELAKAGLGARNVLLAGDRVDNRAQVLRIGLARPNRDPGHIARLLVRRIEEIEPGYGIDALTLDVRRADPLGAEALDTDLASDATPGIAPLVDTLANRIGVQRLWRATPVESDVPERSARRAAPLHSPQQDGSRLKADAVEQLDTRAADHPWHPRWPRPVRLLRRPEQLDHVLAEMPDHPPRRFSWRGRPYRVLRADGPERIQGEWWRRSGERDAVRDYFQVEEEGGARFWLFRRGDGLRPETGDLNWFLHGAFG